MWKNREYPVKVTMRVPLTKHNLFVKGGRPFCFVWHSGAINLVFLIFFKKKEREQWH